LEKLERFKKLEEMEQLLGAAAVKQQKTQGRAGGDEKGGGALGPEGAEES
jgi:hypothetical protein